MKLTLAAGCAGAILLFAAAAAAQPLPPPPPPADYADDSYSPDDPAQADDDAMTDDQVDDGQFDPGQSDGGQPDDGQIDDGQTYTDAGEPFDPDEPSMEGAAPDDQDMQTMDGNGAPHDDAGAYGYDSPADGADTSVPADAGDPPYAYPAPGMDDSPYPPMPPLPPEPPRPPEPPMPDMEGYGSGTLAIREARLAQAIRQGVRRGELDERDGYEAQRELDAISAERQHLEGEGGGYGDEMARLDGRLRQLQGDVSHMRRGGPR